MLALRAIQALHGGFSQFSLKAILQPPAACSRTTSEPTVSNVDDLIHRFYNILAIEEWSIFI
jgi:hypothetical protein